MKTALIFGITGQTGAYLSRELLHAGYRVVGTSRNWSESPTWRLERLGLLSDVVGFSVSLDDYTELARALDSTGPDEIYYLAGPSSVAGSFGAPTAAMTDIFQPVIAILDLLKRRESTSTFVNAASTDCFGNQPSQLLSEDSPMRPVSPYAIAKTATFSTTQNYREAFNLRASSAILTNHESPLRGPDFVTQKIISGLRDVKKGKRGKIYLGNTAIGRDWLWASDVARGLRVMGSAPQSRDYVVASGRTSTLDDFARLACGQFDLDPNDVISHESSLMRPLEIERTSLNPSKIQQELNWAPEVSFENLVSRLAQDVL
jgi:GDPmannose 4,6-dehydratase